MSNIIYRVLDRKGKYQQSYSDSMSGGYSWAVDCANLTNGEVYKVCLDDASNTESSVKIYPQKQNKNDI
tara:strand:- start:267 stop:473 length:207 start_codon:yes stop_codon:yes gene_type:complete